MIDKIQTDKLNYRINMYYYQRARDAMFDVVQQLFDDGYQDIFIPGYIGWSPREGSGIFDPINQIEGLSRHYYRMTKELTIDIDALRNSLSKKSILLIVNYFGFRDKEIKTAIQVAKDNECVAIEDNAHGFFTFFCHGSVGADITFFSLHKMFPFENGGSLLLLNDQLNVQPKRRLEEPIELTPLVYDINGIASRRKNNYSLLMALMEGNEDYFVPLKSIDDITFNVPQTFPIIIRRGNRDKIYEYMNERGYGVVSLYHTMIEELRNDEHSEACWLSKRIMNLPVHQDCDGTEYAKMINTLKEACDNT